MSGLKNAQRISYKATYNQISPTALAKEDPRNPKDPGKSHMRAVEKAAFIQSLGIIASELASLKGRLSEAATAPGGGAGNIGPALEAIQALIDDPTATSTLNSAHLFANV